jgi:hypothetical protein
LRSVLRFLVDRDAHARLAPLFPEAPAWIDDRPDSHDRRAQLTRLILADLGVAMDQVVERADRFVNDDFRPGVPLEIAGFDGAAWLWVDDRGVEPRVLDTSAGRFAIAFDRQSQSLEVTAPDASTIRLPLRPAAVIWADQAPRNSGEFTIEQATPDHRVRLIVGQMLGAWPDGSDDYDVGLLEALLLVD